MKRSVVFVVLLVLGYVLFTIPVVSVEAFDPDTDVFWEYGAESGVLQPPLDHAGMMGDGVRVPPSYAVVTTDYARTGTKSVKLYQVPPTKSDAQSRVTCREYSSINGQTEFYWSWWAYFPDNMGYDSGWSGQWTNLGGLTIRCGPSTWLHKYRMGTSIYLNDGNPRRLYVRWHKPFDSGFYPYYSGFYLNSTYLNTWLHLQCYTKLSNTTAGIHRVWIGDGTTTELVMEETSIKTDPRGYSIWNSENLGFPYPPDGFYAKFQNYAHETSPESWFYADDCVLSYTKVSETYGVGGEPEEHEFPMTPSYMFEPPIIVEWVPTSTPSSATQTPTEETLENWWIISIAVASGLMYYLLSNRRKKRKRTR